MCARWTNNGDNHRHGLADEDVAAGSGVEAGFSRRAPRRAKCRSDCRTSAYRPRHATAPRVDPTQRLTPSPKAARLQLGRRGQWPSHRDGLSDVTERATVMAIT